MLKLCIAVYGLFSFSFMLLELATLILLKVISVPRQRLLMQAFMRPT
jgi:hypothetical protein